ncbi:MAG: histidine phosphatase family protein [Ilumatobacteraceae bacterium]|nr:histidine phosphatase family protein [Ilumatobacteraceae bacterium]
MEMILVRHALPVRREATIGPADPELSEIGHQQARYVADYLVSEKLDALYSSPMKRAVQTCAPIAAALNLSPTIVPGVAEWDQNSNEYIPIEELKASNDPRWQAMLAGEWKSDESMEAFSARVVENIENLINSHSGDRVVVVCHGGVINSYLAHVLGLPNGQFFYPNYTSIHRVAASSRGHRSVISVNETSHLRGTGLVTGLFDAW